jgi:hypothetical protein
MKRIVSMLLLGSLLAACGGPVKRVSVPTASVQQLTVHADGSWSVDLRIENFSSVPMRFDAVSLALTVAGESAGTLQGQPRLTIGPESADVVSLALGPGAAARIVVADALAARRNLPYTLVGRVVAAAEEASHARSYRLDRSSALSPVPGLPGVLR